MTDKKTEKNKDAWEKIASEIFKFEKEGDDIEGVLKHIDQSVNFENKVYKIETAEGMKTIFGTVILDDKMSLVKVGQLCKILYVGSKPNPNPKFNDIKQFDVFVKEND